MERIASLLNLLQTTPEDAFLLHALALEYGKINDSENASLYFEKNLNLHPDYLPTYYHYAKLKEQLDLERAILLYQKGIELAQQQQDFKTKNELELALDFIIDED